MIVRQDLLIDMRTAVEVSKNTVETSLQQRRRGTDRVAEMFGRI